MFSWFLKLLGIEEDKPVSSNNSFMANKANKKSEPSPPKEQAITPEPEAEVISPEPEAEVTSQEPEAGITSPEPEPEPETSPEPVSKSLSEEFPELKANFVKVLTEAGFTSKAAIDKADDKELLALKGIGQATLKILRN